MRDITGIVAAFSTNEKLRQTEQRTRHLLKLFIELLDGLDEAHNTKEWVKMRSELNLVRKWYRSKCQMDKLWAMVPPGGSFTQSEIVDIEAAGKVNGLITKRLSELKKANKEAA